MNFPSRQKPIWRWDRDIADSSQNDRGNVEIQDSRLFYIPPARGRAKHGKIVFPVAVIIGRHRDIALHSMLLDRVGRSTQHIPSSVTEDRMVCRSVAVVISGHWNVAGLAERGDAESTGGFKRVPRSVP